MFMRRIEFKSNLEEEICLTEKERDCLIDYLFIYGYKSLFRCFKHDKS